MAPTRGTLLRFATLAVNVAAYTHSGTKSHPQVSSGRTTYIGRSEFGFDSYLGIRYAQPPVGNLRWQPTVALSGNHTGADVTIHATNYGNNCTLTGSEDCLFLNVWTPPGNKDMNALPVMVFIHGGCYVAGSGNVEMQYMIAGNLDTPVVAVSLNYRLEVMGYLGGDLVKANTSDGSAGNFGTQDQRMALHWIKENIAAFGGNNSNIFLFGESAGKLIIRYFFLLSACKIEVIIRIIRCPLSFIFR